MSCDTGRKPSRGVEVGEGVSHWVVPKNAVKVRVFLVAGRGEPRVRMQRGASDGVILALDVKAMAATRSDIGESVRADIELDVRRRAESVEGRAREEWCGCDGRQMGREVTTQWWMTFVHAAALVWPVAG